MSALSYSLHDAGVFPLCKAILGRAKRDYRSVCKHGDNGNITRAECENFFRGELFAAMTGGFSPDAAMAHIRRGKA